MRTWTTETYPQNEQFSYWREVLCEAFVSLDPVRKRPEVGFTGQVCTRPLDRTAQTTIFSRGQFINRRMEEIRRNPVEFCFANFQLEGSCVVRQDGRESFVAAGDFSVVDSTRPYFLDFRGDWRVLSFRIPRNQLVSKLVSPRETTARCVSGTTGAGLVATQFMRSLDQLDENLSATAQEGLSSALNGVIAVALGCTVDAQEQDQRSLRCALRQAVENYIADNLADPLLSPESIALRFRVSRRTLYSLFEDSPLSVSGTIRELRLERSARDLTRSDRPTVLAVALRWGFNDLSQYSRSFKSRFGVSPRTFATTSVSLQSERKRL
jgi:AraC family transcriptional regulator, positive regulator of tynA and feaB